MDPDVQAFIDKQAERAAAKEKVMEALGRAKIADHLGKDSTADWAIVTEQGSPDGVEGRCSAEMLAMAEAYVAAHPDTFAFLNHFATPYRHDDLVRMIDAFREQGLVEQTQLAVMFELVKFERKQIGGEMKAKMRVGNGG